ncbi:MAG TPA: FAD-dependent monooxygenase, partial [Bryobacteraceae bacterium]|nr:FAD-dependent monooxygenase [Bryobacteraceae bacterium]
ILRTVGIEQIAYKKSEEQFDQDGAVMAVESLAGNELAWYIPNINEGIRDVSPTVKVFLTQNLLEPLLKGRAEELGAELFFGTEMVSFEQDRDGVTAVIRNRDSGTSSRVRAKYMVAADGTHSRVRDALGIRMLGHGVLSNSITIYFRGDVGHLMRGRNLSVIYVNNSDLTGFFRIEKPYQSGFLAVNSLGTPEHPNMDVWDGLTDERCREFLHISLGVSDVPLQIENVMRWQATADTAERFIEGRVFLAGDAAHSMPPTGGFGGNTGVQDAQNLAWKLALVLQGVAGEELLSTYDAERRPVGSFTVEQAYSRYVIRWAPHLGTSTIQPVESDVDIDLGYRYRSKAVLPDSADDGKLLEKTRETKGRPGTRAPHLYLERNGSRISAIDLLGRNFVVLAGPEGGWWRAAAEAAARQARIEVEFHEIADAGFAESYGITPGGAVLVRPDAVVGWRAQTKEGASEQAAAHAMARILGRERPAAAR